MYVMEAIIPLMISQICKYKFHDRKCNLNQKWNKDKCWCQCENPIEYNVCDKDCVWNPSTYTCENDSYLKSITDELVMP